jgi:hypothetical protein
MSSLNTPEDSGYDEANGPLVLMCRPSVKTNMVWLVLTGLAVLIFTGAFVTSFGERMEADIGARIVLGVLAAMSWWGFLWEVHRSSRRATLTIDSEGVDARSWSWIWRSHRNYPMSDFVGMTRRTRITGGEFANSWLWLLLAIVSRAVIIIWRDKKVSHHILTLKHRRGRLRDIRLVRTNDESDMHATMRAVSKRFGVPILDSSLDAPSGYVVRGSEEALGYVREILSHGPGSDYTQFASIPAGVQRREADEAVTVSASPDPLAWLGGVLCGVPFLGLGGYLLIRWLCQGAELRSAHYVVVAILVGVGAWGLIYGLRRSAKRPSVTIRSDGVAYSGWGASDASAFVPWSTIRHVAVAKSPFGKRPAVVVTTDVQDHWIAAGARRAILRWTRDAILAKASRVAQQGSEL